MSRSLVTILDDNARGARLLFLVRSWVRPRSARRISRGFELVSRAARRRPVTTSRADRLAPQAQVGLALRRTARVSPPNSGNSTQAGRKSS
jgi:hypothetical protein